MDWLPSLLGPLTLCMSWSLFMMSKNYVVNLVCLLGTSLMLPVAYMSYYKVFWPCGLILILMSTGLIVIFAYIVSLHPGEKETKFSFSIMMLSVILLMSVYNPSYNKLFHHYSYLDVSLTLSLLLILLLLYVVVSFIRNVYSKGGGFRKKF